MTTKLTTKTYNAFYKENKRSVQSFIFKMTHNIEIAEELVNNVFVKVYQKMHTFDETKSSLRTWVYNIATNTTIDFLRKKKIETVSFNYKDISPNTSVSDEGMCVMDFESDDADPLEKLISSESENSINNLKNLSAQQREILRKLVMGYNYEDIAIEMGIPIGTVKASIHTARMKMKQYFNRPVLA